VHFRKCVLETHIGREFLEVFMKHENSWQQIKANYLSYVSQDLGDVLCIDFAILDPIVEFFLYFLGVLIESKR